MAVSVFDLFKIGIGPSSSHTVGPMRAALMFVQGLERDGLLDATANVKVELYGSLGATGKGHGTDRGVMLGLMGDAPDTVDATTITPRLDAVRKSKTLALLGTHTIPFTLKENIAFYRQALPEHPNRHMPLRRQLSRLPSTIGRVPFIPQPVARDFGARLDLPATRSGRAR